MATSEESIKNSKDLENENDFLSLSLSWHENRQSPAQLTPFQDMLSQPTPSQSTQMFVPIETLDCSSSSRPVRTRRAPTKGKSDTVPPPFPWATDHRATVYSFTDLLKKQIFRVSGEVQCKRCERSFEMEFDLEEKFIQVWKFVAEHKSTMHDRAPRVWMYPILPTCNHCGQENSIKPVIAKKKKSINWLFLLLGQMLGCCTLEQLKYFCKHTNNHRTGAKDRVLYLTYLELCKQLDPEGPF